MTRFFLIFFLICSNISAQFNETWENSDFSSPINWQGDLNKFEIEPAENILKLNAIAEISDAYISTQSNAINNAVWEFSLSMTFNPSSSNYAKIFIVSNRAEFNDEIEGYYVMVGNTQDEVSLWKRKNGSNTKIIDGADKILNTSSNHVSIKVTRDDNGNWELYSKLDESYNLEGVTQDSEINSSSYFGIYCKYTSTRSDKFTFGTINVTGDSFADKEPPMVISHQLKAGNQFNFVFSEDINSELISSDNFIISSSNTSPDRIDAVNNEINLYYNDYLADTQSGQIHIKNIEDLHQNIINDTTLSFSYERIKLEGSKVSNPTSIELTFNKSLEESTLNEIQTEGELNANFYESINDSCVLLRTTTEIIPDKPYALTLSNVKADFGDIIEPTTFNITYRVPHRFDIVFSEIMPDPNPNVGLSDTEYIEIYNRKDYAINLKHFTLSINGKTVILPDYNLGANEYLVIINENYVDEWPSDISILPIKSLATLPNTSGSLILSHPNRLVSDVLKYPIPLKEANFKDDGGWSLEKIDLENQQKESNWLYSVNNNGGTPGEENSVNAINTDEVAPTIKYISFVSAIHYEITFSESINPEQIESLNTVIELADIIQKEITIDSIFYDKLSIHLSKNLTEKIIYLLIFSEDLVDYAGNKLKTHHQYKIGVPEEIDSFDVCINEILFNPVPEGTDFIELYNRSSKILLQSDLYLSSMSNSIPDELHPIDNKNQLFFPNDYLVISEDVSALTQTHQHANYIFTNENNIPSMSDDEGNIAVTGLDGAVYDYFEYTDDMHFELLRDKEGISLERINPNTSTINSNNWHSASEQSGYATPTLQNSQFSDHAISSDSKWVNLDKKEFSPDSDGSDDFVQLDFKLEKPGWTANISVFNKHGQLVKNLAANELMGTHNHITWDGTTNTFNKAPIGIYIIFVDLFSSSGERKQEKLTVVVTAGVRR
ncbi:lamin tail domain-containing protein [Labilibacter marinus]|uniref:lamin tail domain-containing protein n=1 Tax=Labilibacter marinus TaxID=1477105 RepID=UPI00082B307E|nr:lamin tail domain-containing protein [Labilibacter marinus]